MTKFKEIRRTSGWKATAWGQRRDHYFVAGKHKPICKSQATFTTAEPRNNPKYNSCYTCLTALYDAYDKVKSKKVDQ